MDEATLAAATSEEVAHFARRRYRDEESHALYRALAEAAPDGALVARDAGTAIAIAIPHLLDDECFFSELYVEPSFRRIGVGHSLVERARADVDDRSRGGLMQADDPAAAAFALRHGVALQSPVVTIAGAVPREEHLARMGAGQYRFQTDALDVVRSGTLVTGLDREIRGTARGVDHAYFARAATGIAFSIDGDFVGYAYVWASGRIGPVVCASQNYIVQMFAFAMVVLQRTYGASWCTALIPGTNVRLLRAALRAGLSIETMRLFTADTAAYDLSRYVGYHPLLF